MIGRRNKAITIIIDKLQILCDEVEFYIPVFLVYLYKIMSVRGIRSVSSTTTFIYSTTGLVSENSGRLSSVRPRLQSCPAGGCHGEFQQL
jgi:hypothetical protein